jgi:hypothetical protein
VAGIGGLENGAQRNAKTDQLRPVACDGLGIAAVGDFENCQIKLALKFNSSTNVRNFRQSPLRQYLVTGCPSVSQLLLFVNIIVSWCVGLVALLQNVALSWDCAVLQNVPPNGSDCHCLFFQFFKYSFHDFVAMSDMLLS